MHATFLNLYSYEVKFIPFKFLIENLLSFVSTSHQFVIEFSIFETFIYHPLAIYSFKVIKVHPEDTVVLITVELYLLSQGAIPAVRLITPVTVPLSTTPWVSELNELDILSLFIFDLNCWDESVSMTFDYTLLFCLIFIILVLNWATHHIIFLIKV